MKRIDKNKKIDIQSKILFKRGTKTYKDVIKAIDTIKRELEKLEKNPITTTQDNVRLL